MNNKLELKTFDVEFSVCKVKDFSEVNFNDDFVFIGKTDEENSLVCNSKFVPKNIVECEKGWKCFRIQGVLDFSLVGILSEIANVLAKNNISIYAVSTFNTDYILVKEEKYKDAINALSVEGYKIVN